ncbi:MAG: hypothetical protein PHH77_04190 [Victivallaceae bacterium]|nr:hypothetical protein [Victivallaceae bacterium]
MAPPKKDKTTDLKHLVKECPHCQGVILEVAVKCRHCGKVLYDSRSFHIPAFDYPNYTTKRNCMSKPLSFMFQLSGVVLIIIGFVKLETVWWPLIFFPAGITFWMAGAIGARWKKCSNCGYTIANKNISKCPRCYFEFLPDRPGSR